MISTKVVCAVREVVCEVCVYVVCVCVCLCVEDGVEQLRHVHDEDGEVPGSHMS